MARAPKLKVFRMAIGFHDAYVAAPTQKAAIAAWGADDDVFRRGTAELVTDPDLTKEPLARPGEVVKRLRGTAEEQIAALGEAEPPPRAAAKGAAKVRPKTRSKPPPRPKPRPRRDALAAAEAAIEDAEARHGEALKEIAAREAKLARERKALETKQSRERERLEAQRDKAETAYEATMRRWREG